MLMNIHPGLFNNKRLIIKVNDIVFRETNLAYRRGTLFVFVVVVDGDNGHYLFAPKTALNEKIIIKLN